jgi:hypothetical protein
MNKAHKAIAERYGLPSDLSADELATVLETTAAELRGSPETHEETLLSVISAQQRDKRTDLIRRITGEGGDDA